VSDEVSRLRAELDALRNTRTFRWTRPARALYGKLRASERRAEPAKATHGVFAEPRPVPDLGECWFYHSIDLPRHGEVTGEWDLRPGIDDYLGRFTYAGRRVLEIGPASGYVSMELERRGGRVVGVELAEGGLHDFVPRDDVDVAEKHRNHASMLERLKNSYWLVHSEFGLSAQVHYGDPRHLPDALGHFDVTFMGAVLLHCHDPIGLLMSCASRTGEAVIITDVRSPDPDALDRIGQPVCALYPSADNRVIDRWWTFSPQFFVELLGAMGFRDSEVVFHEQHHVAKDMMHPMFTVVARRREPAGDRDEVRSRIEALPWFHRIDLGNGIVTPGLDLDPELRLQQVPLPDDLTGKSVLDVGAWDGLFSFIAEERGAARVLATDHFCWGGGGWGSKECFELARRVRGSRVEDLTIDVMDLSPEALGGTFDVVLFLGVLYHLRNPLLALEKVASVTGELLVLYTQLGALALEQPAAAFYPGRELADDPTNWWAPNVACVVGMLHAVGFRDVEVVQVTPGPGTEGQPEGNGTFYARR